MKKFAFVLFGALFFTQNASAIVSESSLDYSTVDAPYINLEVEDLGDDSVRLTWETEFFEELEDFLYWKVVRSATNPTPVYPDDGYIFYDTNSEADSYIDTNPSNGNNYYRVCGITKTKTRYCSSVIKLEVDRQNTSYNSNGYKNVTNDESLNLELEVQEDGNLLTWEANEYEDFVYWKLVRSKTNSQPSYPDDGYIFYSNYAETDEYLDKSPTSLPVYYRLCAITSERDRYCSNVIYFDPENSEEVESDDDNSEQKICTLEYAPVCGKDGKTYSNACKAEAKNAEVDYEGECEGGELFSDTNKSRYRNAIQYVKRQGLVEGYTDGTYRPDNKINRAEFTKILILAIYNEDDVTSCQLGNTEFSDVNGDIWYAPYVCKAKSKNIIAGYANGTFQPDNEINIAEALKVVLLTYGVELPATTSDEWYAPYWSYALKNNILPDSITSVSQKINRGEMAEIIYNLEQEKSE